ncbi:MAG: fibronectin type III domain-containing protein [Chloroflexi bacterium]|nr:fibronectin type III domain-containing protein [Chloroflexota bacterium]
MPSSGQRPQRAQLRFLPHLLMGAALALVSPLATPVVGGGAPVAAGSSCGTNHDSKSTPPSSIRVHRTATDTVDIVPFREYVGIVMASGEWPYYLPQAVLEVGATATKQYAWYYTLEGNHRSWYRTADGVCYDVKDTTNDQLFRPERADVKEKQLDAIEATWDLTLRKNGRFFLTGYRAGVEPQCGADADGWKIYAKSAIDCAENGMDRQEIQELYLKPRIKFVWTDGGPGDEETLPGTPAVEAPLVALATDGRLAGRAITVEWGATDPTGIRRYALQRRVDGGFWQDVTLPSKTATQIVLGIQDERSYRFRVRAKNNDRNWSTFQVGAPFQASIRESQESALSGGKWHWQRDPNASGGYTRYAATAGARSSLTFTGRAIGLVAPRGPGQGEARISIDGKEVAVIDLGASTESTRRLIFTRTWAVSAERTIQVVLLGTKGRPRVDVDAYLVLE